MQSSQHQLYQHLPMDYKFLYDFELRKLPTKHSYNQYFNPNVCHVCKKPDDGDLTTCPRCDLISYCCDEHRMLDQELHSEFCAAVITATELYDPVLNTCFTLDDWMELWDNIMTSIKQCMQRDLKPHEIEIIMFTKSCFYCHTWTDLRTCMKCYSANYCSDHEELFKEQHKDCQEDLLVLLCVNFECMYNPMPLPYPEYIKFSLFPNQKCFSDMTTFVYEYIVKYRKTVNNYNWYPQHYIYSDYMSNPLTLYYTCKELNILHILDNVEEFVIHIVAADTVDVIGIKAWELFKHLCTNITKMHVVMIESETIFDSYEYKDACNKCRHKYPCEFYFENVTVSYHDYVNTASYKRPNIIIGSLPRFSSAEVWAKSSKVILNQKCPILLMSKSESQILEMKNILQNMIAFNKYWFDENKYRGIRPYRDYETNGILYHNFYVMMIPEFKLLTSCD